MESTQLAGILTTSKTSNNEIVKESRGPKVYLKEKQNNRVFISDERARYNLACLPSDEYPLFVEPEDVPSVEMEGTAIREMINKTIYAVTMEEAGFKLSGVFTEKVVHDDKAFLRMVSTDGHRLSLIEKEIATAGDLEMSTGVMIPKKGMLELAKISPDEGTMKIGFKQSNCVARTADSLLVIRLLETKFPDYSAVIPKRSKSVVRIVRRRCLRT